MLFLSILGGMLAWGEENPSGEILENALIADVSPQGFTSLGGLLPGVVPAQIEVPEFSDESSACWWGGYWYKIVFKDGLADLSISNVELIPQDGYVSLSMDIEIFLNDPTNRFKLNYWLGCVKYSCRGYVNPFPASLDGELFLDFVDPDGDGIKQTDVEFSEDFSYED